MIKKNFLLIFALIIFVSIPSITLGNYYSRGKRYYTHKNYEKATEMFSKAADTTGNGNAYYFLGEIEKIQDNYDKAEEYYMIATEKRNTKRKFLKNAFWNLLIFAERRQDYGKVVRVCKNMWNRMRDRTAKKKIEYLINKILWTDNKKAIQRYKSGIRLKRKGQTKKSIEAFKEAINLDYNFLAPHFEIGFLAYRKGDYDTAASYLGTLAGKVDFYAEVHLMMGAIHYRRKYYSKALSSYNNVFEYGILDRKTVIMTKLKRGTCLYQVGYYDKATEDFKDVLHYNKRMIKPYIMLAAINIKRNEYDKALKRLRSANSLKPNNPVILYQIGSIYYKQKEDAYLPYFDQVFEIMKGKSKYSSRYNKVFNILLQGHYKKKNYTRVTQILRTIPKERYTYKTNLISAKTYYNLNNYIKAIDYFEKLSLANEDRLILSLAYLKSGRKEKAKEVLSYLLYYPDYRDKIKNNKLLRPLLNEIEPKKIEKKEEKIIINTNPPDKKSESGDQKEPKETIEEGSLIK